MLSHYKGISGFRTVLMKIWTTFKSFFHSGKFVFYESKTNAFSACKTDRWWTEWQYGNSHIQHYPSEKGLHLVHLVLKLLTWSFWEDLPYVLPYGKLKVCCWHMDPL